MSQFQLLDDDTAILMINQDTFTVARLKQLISKKLYQKLVEKPGNTSYSIQSSFLQGLIIGEEQNVKISMSNFQFTFPTEGMDCKLLNLNTKEWELGKLRIFSDVKITNNGGNINAKINELKLEFATDEPPLSDIETSLDEFRKQNLEQ
ncbi:MAG: KGK domain-containing protein [Limnoraphis robusta]